MPYSKEHKAETRSRIISSAQMLFKQHGYKNISIDQIMADANLTRGGFYAHFKSKKDLINATLSSRGGREFMTQLLTEATGSYKEQVKTVLAKYLSIYHRDNPAMGCPVAALALSAQHIGGNTSVSYSRLLKGMIKGLQSNLLITLTDEQVLFVITHAVGSLNLARATIGEPEVSKNILLNGQKQLEKYMGLS